MHLLPREPNDGEAVRASDLRLLIRAVRSILPASSSTIRVQSSSSGTTYQVIAPPARAGQAAATTFPYQCGDASTANAPMVTIWPGTHNSFMPQINGSPLIPPATVPPTPAPLLTLGTAAKSVYVQFDFSYNANNVMTIADGQIHSTNDTVPASVLHPGGSSGGGTGTFYEPIAGVSVAVPATSGGSYAVTIYQLVKTIRTIYICAGAVTVVTS